MGKTPRLAQPTIREPLLGARPQLALTIGLTLAFGALLVFPSTLSVPLSGPVFLSLHLLLELLAIVIGFAVFSIQWQATATPELREPRSQFLGAALLSVALTDTLHVLAFPGMPGLFEPSSTENGIIYWLASRLWFSLAMFGAAFLPARVGGLLARPRVMLGLSLTIVPLAVAADVVIPPGTFFVEGRGLTQLKVASELALVVLNLAAIPLYLRLFHQARDRTFLLLALALLVSSLASLSVVLYVGAFDTFNLLGHLFKALGNWLIFDALFVTAVLRPYLRLEMTAQKLATSNTELARLRDHVEGELASTIAQLADTSSSEREARQNAEKAVERLRAIEAITKSALARSDLDQLLEELLRQVCQALSTDSASILLLEPNGETLAVRASRGLGEDGTDGETAIRVRVGKGFAGRIAASGEPLIIEDVGLLADARPALRERVRSIIGVPLQVDGRCIGVLHTGTATRRSFNDGDVGVLQLTADRVATAIERAQSNAELEAVLGALPEALFVYDREGRILRANAAARVLLPYSSEEMKQPVGQRLSRLTMSRPDGTTIASGDSPPMRAVRGETIQGETLMLQRGDEAVWVSASAAPVIDRGRGLLGAVMTLTDVTAIHDLQQQREDLLHTVSHDLRTPLTTIQLQAERVARSLAKGKTGPSELKAANAVLTATRRMDSMIQELVDSARIAAGQLQLVLEEIALPEFIAELLERSEGTIDSARIRLEFAPGLPRVRADPNRLERILMNLITNGLKYSGPDSSVVLTVGAEHGAVVVSVRDMGVGIPADELRRLFERFFRASATRWKDGVGLGLFITRKLVEAHGGSIWAESTPGVGSTFSFRLPSCSSADRDPPASEVSLESASLA